MKHHLIFHSIQLAVLNILLVSCDIPNPAQRQRDVANLSKVFSTLQTLKVEAYRNEDSCKNVAYQRGLFSSTLESSSCNRSDRVTIAMDDRAKQDFQTISSSMATTGVNIESLDATYDRAGRLIRATFRARFRLSTCYHCMYIYSPRYSGLELEGIEGKLKSTAINSDWYFDEDD